MNDAYFVIAVELNVAPPIALPPVLKFEAKTTTNAPVVGTAMLPAEDAAPAPEDIRFTAIISFSRPK